MKIRWWVLIGLVIALIMGVLFILKFNAQLAADFTDNYLRPAIGNTAVVFIEKVFYNTSDVVDRVVYKTTAQKPELPVSGDVITTNSNHGSLNLTPISTEGWHNVPVAAFPNQVVIADTVVQPDDKRPYAVVTVAQIDMSKLRLGSVAGLKNPGGSLGNRGPGVVPTDIVKNNQLVATFDGGFLYEDGQYGMVVGDKVYAPLKPDTATLVGYQDGTFKIVNYTGQDLGPNVLFARQNCPILIENGEIALLNDKSRALWGRTITSNTYTWRSGIGLTKDGNLLYAVGNNLTPLTLSYALQAAGAVEAMQLDINPAWVEFNIFNPTGPGTYTGTPLTKALHNKSARFLHGYNKDFFYLYTK